jgi:hypothetical protein
MIFNFSYNFENAKIRMFNDPIQATIDNYQASINTQTSIKDNLTTQNTAAQTWLNALKNTSEYYDYSRSRNSVSWWNNAAWNGTGVDCGTGGATPAGRGTAWYDTWWGRDGSCWYAECKSENSTTVAKRKFISTTIITIGEIDKLIASYQKIVNDNRALLKQPVPGITPPLSSIKLYTTQYLPIYIKTLNDEKKIKIINNIIAGVTSTVDDIYNAWIK